MIARFRDQPRGVYLMFATEFWERFSYYGFMGLVVLFMVSPSASGGLNYSRPAALFLFGIVTSLIWVAPMFGGWIADRLTGPRRAVLAGCAGLAIGNYLLAGASFMAGTVQAGLLFWAGIVAMIAGAGMFKSNASALLGTLFAPGDMRREAGFILFYMGINIGALVAPFGAGTLGERVGWGWGFLAAGIGMTIGLVLFSALAKRHFPDVADVPRDERAHARDEPAGPLLANPNVQLILLMALFTIVYMTGQMTYGGIMNLYAADRIDRLVMGFEIPATWFLSLNPLLVVLLGAPVASFWQRRAVTPHRVLFVEKIIAGLVLMAASFVVMLVAELGGGGAKSPLLLVAFYILITTAELCILPAGLVEISRRAPRGAVGRLMGVWIFTMGAGSFLAGYLGSLSDRESLATIFSILIGGGIGGALLLLLIEPLLRRHLGALAVSPA